MSRTRRARAVLLALVLAATVTAGCGQKPGVNQMYAGPGGRQVAGDGMGAQSGSIPGVAPGEEAGATPGAGPGLAGSGSGTRGPGTASRGGAGGSEGGLAAARQGGGSGGAAGDRTGVTADRITIGVHTPVTGAAAIPQRSFERAVGVYFEYVNKRGGINGRKVKVLFEDDEFDPNTARTKCKKMAEQEHAFLLIGGAGSDQIDACARYAASAGVPYLSAGVHETRPGLGPLGALDTYFALSLSYEQQVPLLTRLVGGQFNGQKIALVVADNDSLDNFYGVANRSLRRAVGSDLAMSRRIPKNTTSEAPAIATAICQSGAQAVVWNASPSTLLNVAKSMPCRVTFVGPGLTNGLNVVAQVGCPQVDGALFYSPFPGMDVMRRNEPFVRAYKEKNDGAEPDDIGAAIYGVEKLVGTMLKATGRNLTREAFMSTIARVKVFGTGVYPPTNFTSRFGGTAMNLLQADCGRQEYVTVRRNERP